MLSCSDLANVECVQFVAGFNDITLLLLVQLLPALIVIIAAIKIARFAGEDG